MTDAQALADAEPDPGIPLVPMDLTPEVIGGCEAEPDDQDEDNTPPAADLTGDPLPDGDTLRGRLLLGRYRAARQLTAKLSPLDAEAMAILRRLGWDRFRTTGEYHQHVRHFQGAVAFGPALKVDGVVGPQTIARFRECDRRLKAGLPTASAHFSFIEFRCKGGVRDSACARIWTTRGLILEMEKYRADTRRGVSIVSGCRCLVHNRRVKGASQSRHMRGDAADFPPARSLAWIDDRSLFRGRGYNPRRLVRHGDMRTVRTTWPYYS